VHPAESLGDRPAADLTILVAQVKSLDPLESLGGHPAADVAPGTTATRHLRKLLWCHSVYDDNAYSSKAL
jgi:hypothetical protein